MAERNSRVVGMRMPIAEYEALRALSLAEKKTLGGLALELMRSGRAESARRRPLPNPDG